MYYAIKCQNGEEFSQMELVLHPVLFVCQTTCHNPTCNDNTQ